jgi:hypothetical protein
VGWAGGGGSRSGGPGAGRLGPGPGAQDAHDATVAAARVAVQRLVESGVARGEAARRVSAETGVPRRQLYAPGDAPSAAPGAAVDTAADTAANTAADTAVSDSSDADGRREGSSPP